MSSPRALQATPATENGVAGRGRKARPSFTDDDKQRERKRAMDRKAQRVSREKTRSHIAHLEKMVEILCERNESEATTELMAEVSRLNSEVDRLRKIIETIKSVLRADTFEMESQGRATSNSNGSRRGSQNRDIDELKAFPVKESQPAPEQEHQQQHLPVFDELDSPPAKQQSYTNAHTAPALPVIKECPTPARRQSFHAQELQAPVLNFTPAWSNAVSPQRRPLHNRSMSVSGIGTLPSQFWSQLYPNIPPSVSTAQKPLPNTSPCRIWTKSNRIYAKMFNIKTHSSGAADEITTGTLFKAVKEGWGRIDSSLQSNPVLAVLREIDVQVFPNLDQVTRVALMHKSHLLMKYFLNSDEKNWSLMPSWQRPVPSQSSLQHPIAIDFFAWPALRDRLVSGHPEYFANSHNHSCATLETAGIAPFSIAYQRHFRFSYPFPFDDSYLYNPGTGEYTISPQFERYHADLKYWGVEAEFFEKFPEFKGVMSESHTSTYQAAVCNEGPGRAVSVDLDAIASPGNCQLIDDKIVELDGSTVSSIASSSTAASPEDVHLGDIGDVEMLDHMEGHVRKGPGLTFDFTPEERQAAAGTAYETADAYMMELFNDLPCVI